MKKKKKKLGKDENRYVGGKAPRGEDKLNQLETTGFHPRERRASMHSICG
jgi:hypothetical protein